MSHQGAVRWDRAVQPGPAEPLPALVPSPASSPLVVERTPDPVDGAPAAPVEEAPAAPATAPVVVELSDLHVTHRDRSILRGLSFSVAPGTLTGVMGPAGSGKTTLLRCLAGVQRITGGRALVLGLPAGSGALRSRIGYVAQAPGAHAGRALPALHAELDVREHLRHGARLLHVRRRRIDHVVEQAAEQVRLTAHLGTPAGARAGGELARLALGTALLGEPDLLLLDEPTAGLDPLHREELWDLLHALVARGSTLIVSSRVMDEATGCSRALVLHEGTLLADDTAAGLRSATGTGDLEEAFLRLVSARDEAGWAR
ncbi:MAG: ABC transporter ATP-binding protein [Frankiaceae bacterium]